MSFGSQTNFPARNKASAHSSVTFVPKSEDDHSLAFVTQMGPPIKDPVSRRLVKAYVMQQVGRAKRKPGLVRPLRPLRCLLQVRGTLLSGEHHQIQMPQRFGYPIDEKHYFYPDNNRKENSKDIFSRSETSPTLLNSSFASHNKRRSSVALEDLVYFDGFGGPWGDDGSKWESQCGMNIIDRLGAGRFDPFARFPIELNHRARELVDTIFISRDSTGKLAPLTDAWFHVGMLDAAAFHQLLSGSASYFSRIRSLSLETDTKESIAHHAHAIQIVNRNLAKAETATSDGMVGAIIGFACYYHLRGDMKTWRTHLAGLKEVLSLRGGIHTIDANGLLRVMLSNIDISGSCTLNTAPNFPLPAKQFPNGQRASQSSNKRGFPQRLSVAWRFNFSGQETLMDIVDDAVIEAYNLQEEMAGTNNSIWQDSMYVCNYINPLLHRLLSLPATTHSLRSSSIAEGLRLGAILYLVAIRQTFGIYPTRTTAQIVKVKHLFENWEPSEIAQFSFEDLNLNLIKVWILSLAAVMSDSKELQQWSYQNLHLSMSRLGLQTYTDVERLVEVFLWIPEIHGQQLRVLDSTLIA